jgi:hypothetical protein
MTKRYVGNLEVNIDNDNVTFTYPDNTTLPPKIEWTNHCIWSDNGKLFKPVNKSAEINMEECVKQLEKHGFTKVKKDGSRKTTTLKYAIQAYNDKFNFLK